eukprot:scaffold5545_cov111-Isochrysis_galbana.AAC.7
MPFPWCTSQSTISTRRTPSLDRATAAATATLLSRQKPIACCASQWCPGGRTMPNACGRGQRSRGTTEAEGRVGRGLAMGRHH